MRSDSSRVINIYEVPETIARHVLEVLKNDLKEYESLDGDFGVGTEAALKAFVAELDKHFSVDRKL
ncbi:hypothetical protein [Effusibacillus lacus]|uniref:Uncharacterized protein n=1 Tax=Effusibacillus lacus TaxID=1348429 RepID=A0A292YQ26_9BACL|nr:hypothetical protein [Effusibacillus lacus]TCS73187.1 hypothetical protein EDD64_11966 [Effusibacillus lacus]GAX90590.1 hypothetical protein EFBL_2217 [Effusibacillus lacus]